MNNAVKRMLSLWLAIALVAAPLPGFSSAITAQDTAHCMTDQDNPGNLGHTMPGCKHCEEGACSDQGCSPCHGSLVTVSTCPSNVILTPQRLLAGSETDLTSRIDPPPLPPPL
jgi:hypothetical protein